MKVAGAGTSTEIKVVSGGYLADIFAASLMQILTSLVMTNIGETHMSLFSQLEHIAQQRPDAPAIIQDSKNISFARLVALARNIASGLINAGLRAGDRVAIHIGNRPELIAVYYACLGTGAVLVPIHIKRSCSETEYLIAHSAARFYLGDAERYMVSADIIEKSNTLERAWILDFSSPTQRTRTWAELLASPLRDFPSPDDNSLAAIFYTSGTSGTFKGIVHSYSTLGAAVNLMETTMNPLTTQDAEHASFFCSMFDLVIPWNILMTLTGLRRGSPLALMTSPTPEKTLLLLSTGRIGFITGASSSFNALISAARAAKTPPPNLSGTYCVTGGEACSLTVSRDFFKTFGTHLRNSYGQTESGGPVVYQPNIDSCSEPSIGWPLPGVDIVIDAAAEESGELQIRSPANTIGLWNGTGVDYLDRKRWLATGDIVRQLPNGCLLYIARQNDMIKVGGYPVSPLEIERELTAHPQVAGAIVFGVIDATSGEYPIALVQPCAETALDTGELSVYLSSRLPAYKQPREFILVETLPVSSAGKISRRQIASDYVTLKNKVNSTAN
ncbi:class I adenylate-forming enzyme family protein [Dickeya poaceiphila]|uniref:Acyl--CoA ligase n=1 Tax=Dickeya poaceiphila TaxID=568768 RepID=A0A5B8IEQ8_9GAMM|nr:class I adenylate-forming enzyme family protein [Dickeya poaceiphila]QDX30997.1 acyl--CoA ligase [Dickeya poaceiphila]